MFDRCMWAPREPHHWGHHDEAAEAFAHCTYRPGTLSETKPGGTAISHSHCDDCHRFHQAHFFLSRREGSWIQKSPANHLPSSGRVSQSLLCCPQLGQRRLSRNALGTHSGSTRVQGSVTCFVHSEKVVMFLSSCGTAPHPRTWSSYPFRDAHKHGQEARLPPGGLEDFTERDSSLLL